MLFRDADDMIMKKFFTFGVHFGNISVHGSIYHLNECMHNGE